MSAPAPAPQTRRRDFPAWIYITSFFVIVLFALLPLITTLIAVGIAQANDCRVDESSVHPCIINGVDHGADLQAAANSFWLTFISVPAAFLLFIVWLVVFIIHLMRSGRNRKAAA
jgi:hypothetical protein